MKDGVYEHINRLRTEMAGITKSPILERFLDDLCQLIDREYGTDGYIREKREVLLQNLTLTGIDHTVHIEQAFSAYNEIAIFLHLRNKCTITPLEKDKVPTPDFIVKSLDGKSANLELFTPFFADSKQSIIAIQNEWMRVNIEVEEIRAGRVENDPPSISYNAFRKHGQKGIITRKQIINILHNKISKTAKQKQLLYKDNPAILLVDLGVIDYHFFFQEGLPNYVYPYQSEMISGIFWHLCFGKVGERIMESPEFSGKPCIMGEIDKQGILYEYPKIKALIIGIRWGKEVRMIGLHTAAMNDKSVLETLYKTCDFVNNDLNTNYAEIGYDPMKNQYPQKEQ